jgi:hypothetical protein
MIGYTMKNNYCSPSNTNYRENRIAKLYQVKSVLLLLHNYGTARVKMMTKHFLSLNLRYHHKHLLEPYQEFIGYNSHLYSYNLSAVLAMMFRCGRWVSGNYEYLSGAFGADRMIRTGSLARWPVSL